MIQRRKFIQLSAMAGVAIGITGISCSYRNTSLYNILDNPQALSQICDLKTLQEIGVAYRLHTESENNAEKLVTLLLADSGGNRVPSVSDSLFVQTLLNEKIKKDFETGNTVILRGWVLALTEARQCALLFVNKQ